MTQVTKSAIFLQVSDNNSKLRRICDAVHYYFIQRKKVLLFLDSLEAATYIDELLWRLPPERFIPHEISQEMTTIPVAITTVQKNVNEASVLFNLSAEVSLLSFHFDTILDLLDGTTSAKLKKSMDRKADYQSKGYSIIEK